MSIPQFITDSTDDGRDIIRFLIDVMNDDLDGARLNHRLAAARLLVIYQRADASFWSYDGCDDIRCPFHGDPEDPDFYEDPNDHHY